MKYIRAYYYEIKFLQRIIYYVWGKKLIVYFRSSAKDGSMNCFVHNPGQRVKCFKYSLYVRANVLNDITIVDDLCLVGGLKYLQFIFI